MIQRARRRRWRASRPPSSKPAHFVVDGGAIRLDGITLVGTRSNLFVRAARAARRRALRERLGRAAGGAAGPGVAGGPAVGARRAAGRDLGHRHGAEVRGHGPGERRLAAGARPARAGDRIAGVRRVRRRRRSSSTASPSRSSAAAGVCDGRIVLEPASSSSTSRFSAQCRALAAHHGPHADPLRRRAARRAAGGPVAAQRQGHAPAHRSTAATSTCRSSWSSRFARPSGPGRTEGSPMTLNLAVDVPGTFEVDSPLANLIAKGVAPNRRHDRAVRGAGTARGAPRRRAGVRGQPLRPRPRRA